ncbi:hypothetical protein Ssi02_77430 [Sinosporangium siamense]|uniref:Uncharacterized protein n=1 Tax=Sinosporangium siamense TaxID=1367973 RepID=A0A919RQP1_9ACTN|nr:hypothetical protein [Sinosporangium siamense]GII97512.1 hypothetical protein Ssi02_77430 [Sinosporangium siamense]
MDAGAAGEAEAHEGEGVGAQGAGVVDDEADRGGGRGRPGGCADRDDLRPGPQQLFAARAGSDPEVGGEVGLAELEAGDAGARARAGASNRAAADSSRGTGAIEPAGMPAACSAAVRCASRAARPAAVSALAT